jgi:hypothetical protein
MGTNHKVCLQKIEAIMTAADCRIIILQSSCTGQVKPSNPIPGAKAGNLYEQLILHGSMAIEAK